MKKIIALLLTCILLFSLAGCGKEKESVQTPDTPKPAKSVETAAPKSAEKAEEKPAEETAALKAQAPSMVETIRGKELNFEENDVVVIKDYSGEYADNLEKLEIYGNSAGYQSYTIAVFGTINNVSFDCGHYESEGYSFAGSESIDNALITLKNAPTSDSENYVGMSFMDSNGKHYKVDFANNAKDKGIAVIKDSGIHNPIVDKGHILKATYPGQGYKIYIEIDKSKKVQNQYKNYMYIKYDNQDKVLLAQSVDQGEDWSNSVRNILTPIMSSDGKKLYYETDAYSRTNGAGANNHFTRVIDIASGEDEFLTSGALVCILSEASPYAGYFVLQGYRSAANGVVPTYWVENPQGETLVNLGEYLDVYVEDQVYEALQGQNPVYHRDGSFDILKAGNDEELFHGSKFSQ